ncbi:unnamed protein product, partial [Ilex paraguariensis]
MAGPAFASIFGQTVKPWTSFEEFPAFQQLRSRRFKSFGVQQLRLSHLHLGRSQQLRFSYQ